MTSEERNAAIDAELDHRRLADWLVGRQLLNRSQDLTIDVIQGGNQNVVARLGGGVVPMILRRPTRIVPDGRNTAMEREFRVLTALEGTDVPHATPLAICADHDVLGATFYVMAQVQGWSPAASRDWPAPFGIDSLGMEHGKGVRHELATELVRGLTTLAAVDWRAQGLDGFGKPDNFHHRQVDRWTSHWDTFRFRDIPGLDDAGVWLRENPPAQWTPGIMHGDYSFLNVMFSAGPRPELAAIVDWEMATIGDPVLDLAWLARQWPARGESLQTRYVDYTGMPLREDIVDIYRSLSGNPLEDFTYYEVLANFKVAIILEGGYARYLKGEVDNPKLAHYNETVLKAGRAAAALAARG